MSDLIRSIVKYTLLIIIAYTAFSLMFSNRVTNQYFSVVLSDGWAVGTPITDKDNVVSGSFINKRTKTTVTLKIQPSGINAELDNLGETLSDLTNQIFNSDLDKSKLIQAEGYKYSTYKDSEGAGIVLKTTDNKTQAVINVYGPAHADGVDFVNTFFNKNEALFPHFVDPSVPENSFNYILWIRTFKTWIHAYLSPSNWF